MVTLRSVIAFGALLFAPTLAHSVQRNPLNYISSIEDATIHTPSSRVHAHSSFDLTFSLDNGRKIKLSLAPNPDLIHDDLAMTVLAADGSVKSTEPVHRSQHKVYRGDALIERPGESGWSKAGWARITVHRDGRHPVFDGVFRLDGDHHHVHTASHYAHLKHPLDPALPAHPSLAADETMVVWRDSDIQTHDLRRHAPSQLCLSDSLSFNSKFDFPQQHSPLANMRIPSLLPRQSIESGPSSGSGGLDLINSIGKMDGCPTSKKVALVGIATDCTYWQGFNSSEELRKHVIGMVNQASQLYETTFRISLGIKNLTVLERGCPGNPSPATPWNVDCNPGTTISQRLNLFSAWRGRSPDSNAYWTLLTSCPTDSAVGLAWRGQVCRPGSGTSSDGSGNNETVAATNVVVRASTEWQIFAHETGHTFGAIHDCTADACPVDPGNPGCCPLNATLCDAGARFIMNPSTGSGITNFSPCSVGNICSSLKAAALSQCLTDNRNVVTITGSQCGNGIVEPGEQCDCGGDQACQGNPCCNPKTCQFSQGAVCDPSNEDCCTPQCRFSPASTVCRASTGECDVAESCPGDAAKCPDDGYKADGTSCGSGNGLQCASGDCTSRDRQCQIMVGTGANNITGGFGSGGSSSAKSCPETPDSCQISCATSSSNNPFGGGQCLIFGQNFADGTPCGGGGHCRGGTCRGSSTAKEIQNWIETHKKIVIPVAVILGVLLLAVMASCLLNCLRRARRRAAPKSWPQPPPPAYPPPYYQGHADGWQQPPRYA